MKKIFVSLSLILMAALAVMAQDDVYPVGANQGVFYIIHANIHVGNGQVINDGTLKVNKDKLELVGKDIPLPAGGVKVYDAKGKQVYPGLILAVTDLGLKEVANGVRGSNDYAEIGEYNPSVRSIVAYNTDSKVINTLKANGILLASVAPQGGVISGSSSVVQLDAWNWEDAAYQLDGAIHMEMPSFLPRNGRRGGFPGQSGPVGPAPDPLRLALDKVEEIKSFFRQAAAYLAEASHSHVNLKFEALRGLFSKKQKLFVHADQVRQMLVAIDFAKEFGFEVVIVGASESWQIAGLLKQNNIAVILQQEHSLPATEDDDVDQPYKTPAQLHKAGVLFALNDENDETRYRNLAFNAGTAAAYGLTREEALQAITLDAARILGIGDRTGSLEAGKDANILICEGDILDMKSSIVTDAFIQGRKVSLENKQAQLNERYRLKYGLK